MVFAYLVMVGWFRKAKLPVTVIKFQHQMMSNPEIVENLFLFLHVRIPNLQDCHKQYFRELIEGNCHEVIDLITKKTVLNDDYMCLYEDPGRVCANLMKLVYNH